MQTLAELMEILPQTGRVTWIGVRPSRNEPMQTPEAVEAVVGRGLTGDRFGGRRNKREVTLIQAEHINVVASVMGYEIDPSILRRNIVVRGLNLLALKGRRFAIGDVVLEYTGLAHPCSKMEAALGPGGYNAMRGHGGITCCLVESGVVRVGDAVRVVE